MQGKRINQKKNRGLGTALNFPDVLGKHSVPKIYNTFHGCYFIFWFKIQMYKAIIFQRNRLQICNNLGHGDEPEAPGETPGLKNIFYGIFCALIRHIHIIILRRINLQKFADTSSSSRIHHSGNRELSYC